MCNILLFIPFGVLFPCKSKGLWFCVLSGAILSLSIEVIQYVLILGWCEVDDVICNAFGAAIGFGILKIIAKA